MERRQGTVTDGTDPDRPLVVIDGDSTAAPAWNMDSGYAPMAGDRVQLSVGGGVRLLTYGHPAGWQTSLPSPIFAQGVTEGDGTYGGRRWCLYRSAGRLMMDYQGRFQLGSTSAITDSVQLTIPGGFSTPSTPSQYFNTAYVDGLTTIPGRAAASPSATVVVLQHFTGSNFGVLSSADPFVWASGDAIRWDIRGLEVAV